MNDNRFARTDPFLDGLEAIGYDAIPKSEYDALRDALEAREAACGHLSNELVAKALDWTRDDLAWTAHFTDREVNALYAATFEVPA